MRIHSWISLWAVLAAACAARATYTYYSTGQCDCSGRSRTCLRDAWGLHCVDCQGNTEGRRCERCRAGFYLQGAGLSCTPCRCNPAGSSSSLCDSRGRCSCNEGVAGEKCDRCADGPIGPSGCMRRRRPRQDSPQTCFCYGHSRQCLPQSGYSVHDISSTFASGPDGWKVATAQGVTPDDVHFRWSPTYQDLEVISQNSLPVYLFAPAPFLGNQLLSYGRNFSFSLRLDRGVRHPSTSDVILEGAGLKVSASLGDLRTIVACGKKITYVFRLDEKPSNTWRPELSSFQFQTLLQNLTAIKIRATFGENGRGYLDNVQLASARRGDGVPASWVHTCGCPQGHEGDFCQRCSTGFRRSSPADGTFSRCEPCRCSGGSCDPQTGDCYSADETPGERSCSGGFYHSRSSDACQPCNCDALGSESGQCDPSGRCRCRPGFEGLRCQRSNCPACFSPVRAKMEAYATKLKELESLSSNTASSAEMEAALSESERLVVDLQDSTEQLKELERILQARMSSISRRQLAEGQDIHNIAGTVDGIKQQQKTYKAKVEEVQALMEDMKRQLEEARSSLRAAEIPLGDSPQPPNLLTSLAQTAAGLAAEHQTEAGAVERAAGEALSDSEEGLALVRALMNKESKVRELIGDLKTTYDRTTAQVKALENQATLVSSEATGESTMAENMLADISSMEPRLPSAPQEKTFARLDVLRDAVENSILGWEALQQDPTAVRDLLAKGAAARQDVNELLGRVDAAKATTDGALQRIGSNSRDLDDALGSLRGFDQQIDVSRAAAEGAIKRLPVINATIQEAVSNNAATKSVLEGVAGSFSDVQELIPELERTLDGLEQTAGSLPSSAGLVNEATKLNEESKVLKAKTSDTDERLKSELDRVRTQEADAELAAAGAAAAFTAARRTRDAVGRTLRDVDALLAHLNEPGAVDEQQVKQLEETLARAQTEVNLKLKPRFRDMEEQEAAMRQQLLGINMDLDQIQANIANLEANLASIPKVCLNNAPIEQA